MLDILLLTAVFLLGIALAGIASDKHFVAIMLAIELIFIGSTVALAYFFAYSQNAGSSAVVMFVAIWTVAAVEVITLITFYVYMKSKGFDFNVAKLSKLKW